MNTRNLLIIIATCILLGAVSFLVYRGLTGSQTKEEQGSSATSSSPFGDITSGTNGTRNQGSNNQTQSGFGNDNDGDSTSTNSNNTTSGDSSDFAPLVKLSQERASGVGFATVQITKEVMEPLAKPAADGATTTKKVITVPSLRIRYVERASGHIYEYNPDTKETKKLTNTTIPKTEESFFVDDGKRVIMRYLGDDNQTIESYLGVLPLGNVTDKLTGGFLPENILSITRSPDTKEVFYITKTSTGSVGNILNIVDLKERRVFESPFSEWLTYWGADGITLHTKASSKYPGYAYLLKTNGGYTKIAGSIPGLTASETSTNSLVVLGSNSSSASGLLSIYNTKTKTAVQVPNLTTFTEKCVWASEGAFLFCAAPRTPELAPNLLDTWYKGATFTADDFYFINTIDGNAEFFADISELMKTKTELDVVQMQISQSGEYLVFIDKKTGTPWVLNLSRISETLLQ